MTIMVVASPCALVISTPATVLSAIGGAARRGILIKGGSHLERAAHIDIVAIDKTGTLTVGKPSLTEIVTATGIHPLSSPLPADTLPLLRVAAALEAKSEHPLAHAIVVSAAALGIDPPPATDFQSTAGKGAEATVDDTRYLVGSERLVPRTPGRRPRSVGRKLSNRCRPMAKPASGSARATATKSPPWPCSPWPIPSAPPPATSPASSNC